MDYQAKYEQAKAAGYSDSEIAQHLGGAKYQTARDAGYSDTEIINHLTGLKLSGEQSQISNARSDGERATQSDPKFYQLEKQQTLPETPGGKLKEMGQHFLEAAKSPVPGSLIKAPFTSAQKFAQEAGASVAKGLAPKIGVAGARLAGLGTQIIGDPASYGGAGAGVSAGKSVAEGTAKVVGDQATALASGVSNVSIKAIRKFFSDPMAVLKAPSSKEAGAILQKAKELAGVTREEEFLIAKAADRATGASRTVAEELRPRFEATKGLEKAAGDIKALTVGELIAFNRAVGKLASEAKGSERALYGGLKKQAQAALESRAAKVAESLETYALSKTKDAFKSIIPLTKSGRADYFKAIGTALTSGLTSPLAVGGYTLAAKGLSKLVKPVGAAIGGTVGGLGGFTISQMSDINKKELDRLQNKMRLKNAK